MNERNGNSFAIVFMTLIEVYIQLSGVLIGFILQYFLLLKQDLYCDWFDRTSIGRTIDWEGSG